MPSEWSRETLLEAWMEDPVACCESCGVTPPPGLRDPGTDPSALSDPGVGVAGAVAPGGGITEHELRSPTVLTHTTQPGEEVGHPYIYNFMGFHQFLFVLLHWTKM